MLAQEARAEAGTASSLNATAYKGTAIHERKLNVRHAALTAVMALAATTALAAGQTAPGTTAGSDAAATGKPAVQGAGDTYLAKEFWTKNAKDGFLTRDAAKQFKGADGKEVDMQKLDADSDGRISEREWASYHEAAGAAGLGQSKATGTNTGSSGMKR